MKFFWDTNLFIYLWEDSAWRDETRAFADRIVSGKHAVVTSALTVAEVLVQPLKQRQEDARDLYLDAFRRLQIVPFDIEAAAVFAALRAKHAGLRPPDAIQLACASVVKCDVFVTNDQRLSSIDTPRVRKVVSLRDWRMVF